MAPLQDAVFFLSGHGIFYQFPLLMGIDDSLPDGIFFSSGHGIFSQFPLMGLDYTFSRNGFILVYSWNNLVILFLDWIRWHPSKNLVHSRLSWIFFPFPLNMGTNDPFPRSDFILVLSWNNLPISFEYGNGWPSPHNWFHSGLVLE